MNAGFAINIISALLAGATFVAIVYPLLRRRDNRSRYSDLIERRRHDLHKNAVDALDSERPQKESARTLDFSAKSNVESFFKVKKLVGSMTDDLRSRLLNAGYRDQSAALVFVLARVALPILFVALAMFFISASHKELPQAVVLLMLLGLAGFGFALPAIVLKNQTIKRQEEINLSFPDALDMILVCVQGGISLEQAINRIADEMADHSRVMSEELGVLGAELGLLGDRRLALHAFAGRVGSGAARSFATAMIQAEQYGTSISGALRVMAEELRGARMAEAERKAASLPPKLTVPMILFFMPALFIVILGPAGISATMVGR